MKSLFLILFIINAISAFSFEINSEEMPNKINQKIWKKCFSPKKYGPKRLRRVMSKSEKKLCIRYKTIKKIQDKKSKYLRSKKSLLYDLELDIDATSLGFNDLKKYKICESNYKPSRVLKNGTRIKMLGMAFVYMPGSYNSSVVGHVAERYIWCKDNQIQDYLFEYTQITNNELSNIKIKMKMPDTLQTTNYLESILGDIFVFVIKNPTNKNNRGYGYYQVNNNRDMIEMWPNVTENQMYEGLNQNKKEYKNQLQRFQKFEKLKDYDLFTNNCTHPLRERLNHFGGEFEISNWQGFAPKFIFDFLKTKDIAKMIIYPSQRLLRKLQMLERGKSLWFEHITFLTKTADTNRDDFLFLYPEFRGIKKLFLNPIYSSLNFVSALVESIYGIISMPIELISDLSGLNFFNNQARHATLGIKGMGLSLSELFGVRLRYPRGNVWTPEELSFIREELPLQTPKIIPYLRTKLDVIE